MRRDRRWECRRPGQRARRLPPRLPAACRAAGQGGTSIYLNMPDGTADVKLAFEPVVAEWRNWQTHQTQNLAKFTLREGSTPSSATTFVFFHIPESAGFVGHYRAIRRKNEAWTYADSLGYVKGNAWRPNRSSAPVGSVPIAGAAGMSKSGANRLQGSENCRSLGSAAL